MLGQHRFKYLHLITFVMPAIFILIMSVAMRDQFSTNNLEFTMYVNDADRSEMSEKIISNLLQHILFA